MIRRSRGGLRLPVTGLLLACALAACRQALTTLIDLPPPGAATPAAPADATSYAPPTTPADTVRPRIETLYHPDSVRALLPRDHAGNLDWMAALRSGLIRPRPALPGQRAPADGGGFQFAFDFSYPGPDTTFDAFFPHSSHTEWLACQQCHPRIFEYRNTTVKMGDIFQGKYCGECHGKVAFPVLTGCERCHRRMVMPAGRAQGQFLGTLTLQRPGDATGAATGIRTDGLPPAVFPHWVHRIRYRCKACHMELFEPRQGANRITMQQIAAGAACGRCHNGAVAFAATIGTCQRCHVRPDTALAAGS